MFLSEIITNVDFQVGKIVCNLNSKPNGQLGDLKICYNLCKLWINDRFILH